MQRELSDVCFFVNAENADAYAQKIKDAYSSKQLLSKLPVIEGVWGADRAKPNGRYKFKTVFNAAHEDLAEPQKLATLSVDPSDRIYNTSIRQNLLEYRMALSLLYRRYTRLSISIQHAISSTNFREHWRCYVLL